MPKDRTYQICTKCVMDTTDPDITFDDQGICNHCYKYEKDNSKFSSPEQKKQALEALVARIKAAGKGKDYDCLIGVSGGVDSTYVAYLVKNLGLRPLAVHLDNGWNSELAVMNIENILKKLDIDLYTHVINWEEFKDLQLAFLKASTPDSEIPSDHAIFALMRKIAKDQKIDYIISGINTRTESHHPRAWSQGHEDWLYIKSIHKQFGSKPLKTFPHGNLWSFYTARFSKKWVNILDYVDYIKEDAKRTIADKLSWRDYGGKHFESIYTRFFQGYILPVKFGFDKRKMHLSSLICAGEISRDQALKMLEEPIYPKNMQDDDREFVIKKFNITEQQFKEIMALPVKKYFDYPCYPNTFLHRTLKKIFR
ncbi:N-acetyl sugar amidotransferase [Pedobacter deserti]|uniref:N-acetyl sugar amidotransferase n=1 Tax=Pedobacter deserti TaxID=2817382 RepID=UPI00210F0E85|nr:N-acetyl sugar amidotransferase [Pedobacter sp. SYSU D00382]